MRGDPRGDSKGAFAHPQAHPPAQGGDFGRLCFPSLPLHHGALASWSFFGGRITLLSLWDLSSLTRD